MTPAEQKADAFYAEIYAVAERAAEHMLGRTINDMLIVERDAVKAGIRAGMYVAIQVAMEDRNAEAQDSDGESKEGTDGKRSEAAAQGTSEGSGIH